MKATCPGCEKRTSLCTALPSETMTTFFHVLRKVSLQGTFHFTTLVRIKRLLGQVFLGDFLDVDGRRQGLLQGLLQALDGGADQ